MPLITEIYMVRNLLIHPVLNGNYYIIYDQTFFRLGNFIIFCCYFSCKFIS